VIVEHEGLAGVFEQFLLHDLEQAREAGAPELAAVPDLLVPVSLRELSDEEVAALELTAQYFEAKIYRRRSDRPIRVLPLLTPDNYQREVLRLIQGAERRIYFENQTLNPGRTQQPEFKALLDALKDKQREGLDVRIIFREFPDARRKLERLQDYGFDTGDIRVQRNCHTKGIVVDGSRVLIGSHNWSNSGTLYNRDASLIFYHRGIARYYEKLFLFDWDHLARQQIGHELAMPELLVDEARGVPEGMVRMSWMDYFEG